MGKGYEFDRGQFVTLSPEELKALDLESSHTIDLTSFVARDEVDPVYFNAPYYVHPDGEIAAEAFRVIGAAMAEAGVAGIGRMTMARRERQVLVEPRGAGMVLITCRRRGVWNQESDQRSGTPSTAAKRDNRTPTARYLS